MTITIERLEHIPNTIVGEGPHWDGDTQSLIFVDIFGSSIHKYVPATNKHTRASIRSVTSGTNQVSLIVPVKGQKNKFVVGVGRDIALIEWDGENGEISIGQKLYEVDNEPDVVDNRLNDGKCDPTGRLWAGTMGGPENGWFKKEKGSLYSFDRNGITKHISKVGLSNGLAWDEHRKKFYYIDTEKATIDAYDYDITNNAISNGKSIFSLKHHNIEGILDGMTIDTDGNIWVAVFGDNSVLKIDPSKSETILRNLKLPAKQPTSVAFGGPNLDELYVTSASYCWNNVELSPPLDGGTYRITGLNVKGYPGVSAIL